MVIDKMLERMRTVTTMSCDPWCIWRKKTLNTMKNLLCFSERYEKVIWEM